MLGGVVILRCPKCIPIATRVTRADGSKLGWQPESLYVGYLIVPRALFKKPPVLCPTCQSALVLQGGSNA